MGVSSKVQLKVFGRVVAEVEINQGGGGFPSRERMMIGARPIREISPNLVGSLAMESLAEMGSFVSDRVAMGSTIDEPLSSEIDADEACRRLRSMGIPRSGVVDVVFNLLAQPSLLEKKDLAGVFKRVVGQVVEKHWEC